MGFLKEFSIIGKIFAVLRGINIHPAYLLVPVSLSLVAAASEGVSVGLLIPMLNGFLVKDFSFMKETPYLGELTAMLPQSIQASDKGLFGVLLAIFFVAVSLKNMLKYLSILSMTYFATRSSHHLRKVIFGRYLSFGKLYFDRTSVGHHATVLSDFTYNALRPIFMVDKYLNALFSLLVYLVVMSLISWKLTAFALPLFFVLHLAVKFMIEKIMKLSHQVTERSAALGKKTVEILSTIPLVKSYSTQSMEKERYSTISDERSRLDFRVKAIQEMVLPLQEMITLCSAVILFSGMLWLMVQEGTSSAPSFIVYFYLVLNAAAKFGTLTGFRGVLAIAHGPMKEVEEIFGEENKHYVRGGEQKFTGLKHDIAFRNLTFAYGDREVLENVSFTVEAGSVTAVVGPTGGGKTTLISLIVRYYDCPEESLFIDGTDIRDFDLQSLLRHIALVSQETLLLHDTLKSNITYGLAHVSEQDLLNAIDRARLQEFVASLPQGLSTLIGDRGVKLSGGEKQRVSIARALLKNAEILILDEATSSLDSSTEKLIQEAMDEAMKDRTAIVIAHRLSTIKNADKIVVVDGGRVAEQGTLEELLAKGGVFKELWEQQRFG